MTKQLAAGIIDETRQILSGEDGSALTNLAREKQLLEADAKKRYQPTPTACQFDTTARYLGRSRQTSGALTTGYALDFNKIGSNEKNSPAATGSGSLQQARWQVYKTKFCDPAANGGKAGCTTPQPTATAAVTPSKTIFAKETIDLSSADTREAVSQLMFNITGYAAPDPVLLGAVPSAVGLQQWQENREYTAQMDAVGALAYSVIADRAPGASAPEIQALRMKGGITDASPTPSAREIRQAVIEQLWDPTYYAELYDSPQTIPQKELYLKAYSLVMLYDLIAKQEKISNVYAIETANMLDKAYKSLRSASAGAPVR